MSNSLEYPHIVKTADTCAGLPRIEGTRITVNLLVREIVHGQRTAGEVLVGHPHLSLAQIHAALAYYYDHRAEVDASLQQADQLEADLRAQFPSRLSPAAVVQR
jgi:uncharacterized protein (DUF433 family)